MNLQAGLEATKAREAGGRRSPAIAAVGAALLALAAAAAATAQDPASAVRTSDGLPYLEIVARHGFAEPAPAAIDLRLGEDGRIYLLRPEVGVDRHRLAPGMPRLREVLPGHDDDGALAGIEHFAVSSSGLLEVARDHFYVWRMVGEDGALGPLNELDLAWGRISDLDLAGDRLALLGVPSREHAAPGPDNSIVWLGSLGVGLEDFRRVLADPMVRTLAEQQRLATAQSLALGSLAFAGDGSLLVYPGHLPELYRLSEQGELEKTWDLARLGILDRRADLPRELAGRAESAAAEQWLAGAQLVDDLTLLADGRPALAVRDLEAGAPRWTLAVIDGERARRFALPVRGGNASSRLRLAGAASGEVLFWVGERNLRRGSAVAGDEIVVARLPSATEVGPARTSSHPWGRLVDLTHPFDANTLAPPGALVGFELEPLPEAAAEPGQVGTSYRFCAPEHAGTHLDAPSHHARGGRAVDALALDQLVAPAVVIDVESQAQRDADFSLELADIEAWESRYGRIPAGSIVLLRTGWSRRWPDRLRYLGTARTEPSAELRFPGFGAAAAALLVRERGVAALGIDTASLDPGSVRDAPVQRLAATAEVPALENLAHLDRLPATGAWIVALPMPLAGGSGAPLRAIAFIP